MAPDCRRNKMRGRKDVLSYRNGSPELGFLYHAAFWFLVCVSVPIFSEYVLLCTSETSLQQQQDIKDTKYRVDHQLRCRLQPVPLHLPDRVYNLKPESDLTPIPGILKPQHHATDVEPHQS